jgi:glycosyltransferase involved in cell wall biosynthesis
VITDGVNGRGVPPDDIAALQAALGSLLSEPAAGVAYGAAARHTAERLFSLEQVSAAYLATYRRMHAP